MEVFGGMEPLRAELENALPVMVDEEDDDECDEVGETDVCVEHGTLDVSDAHGTENVHTLGTILDVVVIVDGD